MDMNESVALYLKSSLEASKRKRIKEVFEGNKQHLDHLTDELVRWQEVLDGGADKTFEPDRARKVAQAKIAEIEKERLATAQQLFKLRDQWT